MDILNTVIALLGLLATVIIGTAKITCHQCDMDDLEGCLS